MNHRFDAAIRKKFKINLEEQVLANELWSERGWVRVDFKKWAFVLSIEEEALKDALEALELRGLVKIENGNVRTTDRWNELYFDMDEKKLDSLMRILWGN